MQFLYRTFFLCLLTFSFVTNSFAQVLPANFAQVRVTAGITRPTAMAFAPDGRIFVTEQSGNLRVIKNNVLLATPFVQLTVNSDGERGLLGVAIDPDFATNQYIYLYHTVPGSPARNRISRFTANGDVAQAGSETLILNLDPLSTATIHNGGAMHFGLDGKLYVAIGENSNASSAQNLDTYHGKLLRINKDGSVPAGNPFPTGSEQRRRVWALGLRNPFTFDIHPTTGRIFLNDVGQNSWEEINDATQGGRNFGWPGTEGNFNQASFPNYTNPVYAYAHGTGDGVGCAITGGAFFAPASTNYPATYQGRYFFQENCNDWINTLTLSGSTGTRSAFGTSIADNGLGMTLGPDGNIYFLSRSGQAVYKIVYNSTTAPSITNQPVNRTVAAGQSVSFSVSVLGTPPLTYQWQKGGVNIPNTNSATYTISQVNNTHAGQYRVIVSNASGSATSTAATLTVINNAVPVATIVTPTAGTTYRAGTSVSFSGQGSDTEDGTLGPQAMSWEINFHHNTHKHDQPPVTGVASGTFSIPTEGETSDNVWYRIILTVTDANGLKGKDSVDIFPLKSTISFATSPPGLQVLLDGQPFSTPGNVVSVEGILRNIDVQSPQTINNVTYQFSSWSHGGAKNQTIATPINNTTYTANFTVSQTTRTFYRAINLNGTATSIDANNWEASAGATNFSYTNGNTFANQNIALSPATDQNRATMIRSSIWGKVKLNITNVPSGNYEVYLYTWEDNRPTTFSVFLENVNVQSNFTTGAAGSWTKLGPYRATISDGSINVSVDGFEANLSGIEIWRNTSTQNNPPVVSSPLQDQEAQAGSAFNYIFPANSFTDPDQGTVLTYSAALANGSPLPTWLQFAGTSRAFSGTPAAANVGSVEVRVTANDGGGGSISDTFVITVQSTSSPTFYRALNLNGPALVIDGNNWEASAGAPNFSYTNGRTFSNQTIALTPATDANRASMIRSSIWGKVNFAIAGVPSGSYQIWVYVWEDNSPATFSISLEGNIVQANFRTGTAGSWSKLGPYTASITDGIINLSATGFESNISGIEIWGSPGASQRVASAARMVSEKIVVENEEPSLAVYPNPVTESATFRFTPTEQAPSDLSMFDTHGRKIHSLFQGDLPTGESKEIVYETTQLPNGIYVLQLKNGNKTTRLKLLVAK